MADGPAVDEGVKMALAQSALRTHRFRQTEPNVWVRGHRFGRRFVARISPDEQTVEVSGRRATVVASYIAEPLSGVGPAVEQAIRSALTA